MKTATSCAVCLLAGVLLAAEAPKMTIAEAREKIADVVKTPELMGEITSQLTAEEQNQFLSEVNKAIVNMPGSNEQKTSKFLSVEREALLAAKKGNLQKMVATMFSTVTLESLTVLAERYADDLFNRAADATKTFTDEQFTEIASSTVKEVAATCDGMSDSAPRDTLAIYLFERATNFSIPELEDTLLAVAISDSQVRATAKNEWLVAAKGTGDDRFSSLLGYAEAGLAPNVDVVLRLAGPQLMTALLTDLANSVVDKNGNRVRPLTTGENPGETWALMGGQSITDKGLTIIPKTSYLDRKWNPSYTRQNAAEKVREAEHPGGYQDQD